jgi:hypothetical protein
MISISKPNEEKFKLMTDGMEIFVSELGDVVAEIVEERH